MFQYSKLKLNDFTGGITDKYIDAPPNTYQKCLNMDITKFGSLETRQGFKWYLEANYGVSDAYGETESWAYLGVVRRPFAPDDIIVNQDKGFYAINDEAEVTFNTKTIVGNVITFDTAHGLATNDEVYIKDVTDSIIGISQDTKYYFKKSNDTTGTLALTAGGDNILLAVDPTADTPNTYDQVVTLVKKATATAINPPSGSSGFVLKESTINSNQPVCFTEWQDHLLVTSKGNSGEDLTRPSRIYNGAAGFYLIVNSYAYRAGTVNKAVCSDDTKSSEVTCVVKDVGVCSDSGIGTTAECVAAGETWTYNKWTPLSNYYSIKDDHGGGDVLDLANVSNVATHTNYLPAAATVKGLVYYFRYHNPDTTDPNIPGDSAPGNLVDNKLADYVWGDIRKTKDDATDTNAVDNWPFELEEVVTYKEDSAAQGISALSDGDTVYSYTNSGLTELKKDADDAAITLDSYIGPINTVKFFPANTWRAETMGLPKPGTQQDGSVIAPLRVYEPFVYVDVDEAPLYESKNGICDTGNVYFPSYDLTITTKGECELVGYVNDSTNQAAAEVIFDAGTFTGGEWISWNTYVWGGKGFYPFNGNYNVVDDMLNIEKAQKGKVNDPDYAYLYKTVFKYVYKVEDIEYTTYGPTSEPVKVGYNFKFGQGIGNTNKTGYEQWEEKDIFPLKTFIDVRSFRSGSTDGPYVDAEWELDRVMVELYRTAANGSLYYYIGEAHNDPNNEFALKPIKDDIEDSDLIYRKELYLNDGTVNFQPAPKARYVISLRDIAFYCNVVEEYIEFDTDIEHDYPSGSTGSTYATAVGSFREKLRPNRVYQSIPGISGSIGSTFYVDLDDEITGAGEAAGMPVIFTGSYIYRLEGILDNTGEGTFRSRVIDEHIGCLSHASIVKTPVGLYFAGNNGFYVTDGYKIKPLTPHLEDSYADLIASDTAKALVNGTYDERTNKIYWGVAKRGSEVADLVWVLDLNTHGFTMMDATRFEAVSMVTRDGELYRGDKQGIVYRHSKDFRHDYPRTLTESTSSTPATLLGVHSWDKKHIDFEYISSANNFGDPSARKWVNEATFSIESPGNIGVLPVSLNDANNITSDLKEITRESTWVWRDPDFSWKSENFSWAIPDVISAPRRFPRKEARCRRKQVGIKPFRHKMYTSGTALDPSWGVITVTFDASDGTMGLFTATLSGTDDSVAHAAAGRCSDSDYITEATCIAAESSPGVPEIWYPDYRIGDAFKWPKKLDGAYIHFPTSYVSDSASVNYKRVSYDSSSTTYTAFRILDKIDDNTITFRGNLVNYQSGMEWYISAFILSQKIELKEIAIKYGLLSNTEGKWQTENEVGG